MRWLRSRGRERSMTEPLKWGGTAKIAVLLLPLGLLSVTTYFLVVWAAKVRQRIVVLDAEAARRMTTT